MRAHTIFAVSLWVIPLAVGHAQGSRSVIRTTTGRSSLNGACASLTSVPSELARTPEGQTLLAFKRELDGVATMFAQRGSAMEAMDARRMSEVQRGVDSLMQVFVRVRTGDGTAGSTITVRRGDSTIVVNGRVLPAGVLGESMETAIKAIRPNVDVTLRAFEPQVAAFSAMREGAAIKASPSGYLGVNLSGSQIRMVTDSGSFTAHCDYPMIEAVDVGSPARAADLRAGDTVVAYNGRDLVALTVNYPQLLVPGKVIRVRIRRDGKSRELPVTVGERPAESAEFNVRFMPAPGSMLTPVPARVGPGGVVRGAPLPTLANGTVGSFAFGANATTMVLLGAQVFAVDDEFAQTFGVEPGVLIMHVQPGSPAAEAGLRAGEMIRAVNGTPVRELPTIKRAISGSGVRDVKLTVSGRDTPVRIVTVRW
ncbi:MAG: PDZ domain-containing protein [Gemmatimonadaceae bacterium]|nr:PDZ domain-containing protein [Gemmatimonadaceae bacterium]